MDTIDEDAAKAVRLFVVEDSSEIQSRIAEAALTIPGARVVGCAETEDDAISGILDRNPNVVVLDIQLRQGNGLNVLSGLKKSAPERRPVVILFTNFPFPEFERFAEKHGAMYFLDKASEFSHLQELLESLSREKLH